MVGKTLKQKLAGAVLKVLPEDGDVTLAIFAPVLFVGLVTFGLDPVLQEVPENTGGSENRTRVLEAFQGRASSIIKMQELLNKSNPIKTNDTLSLLGVDNMVSENTTMLNPLSEDDLNNNIVDLFTALASDVDMTEVDAGNIVTKLSDADITVNNYINDTNDINTAYLDECRISNTDNVSDIYNCTKEKENDPFAILFLSSAPLALGLEVLLLSAYKKNGFVRNYLKKAAAPSTKY